MCLSIWTRLIDISGNVSVTQCCYPVGIIYPIGSIQLLRFRGVSLPHIYSTTRMCVYDEHSISRKMRQASVVLSLTENSATYCGYYSQRTSVINCKYFSSKVGRDSSVGIATCYGLDGPGIESRQGRDFPRPSSAALGPTQHRRRHK